MVRYPRLHRGRSPEAAAGEPKKCRADKPLIEWSEWRGSFLRMKSNGCAVKPRGGPPLISKAFRRLCQNRHGPPAKKETAAPAGPRTAANLLGRQATFRTADYLPARLDAIARMSIRSRPNLTCFSGWLSGRCGFSQGGAPVTGISLLQAMRAALYATLPGRTATPIGARSAATLRRGERGRLPRP